jgi:hypothetical protein
MLFRWFFELRKVLVDQGDVGGVGGVVQVLAELARFRWGSCGAAKRSLAIIDQELPIFTATW